MKSTMNLVSCGASLRVITIMAPLAILAPAAQAGVTISSGATKNMDCAGGTCSPTSKNAVLNVSDLETMLASRNVTVTTTGSNAQAKSLTIDASLGWSSSKVLTLDAEDTIIVDATVSVSGKGGLVINAASDPAPLAFYNGASVTFAKLSSTLVINGNTYILAGSITDIASAFGTNEFAFVALAGNYDASGDGTYPQPPVHADSGFFEGLGNSISNLTINDTAVEDPSDGLFEFIGGTARDFGLINASVSNAPAEGGASAGTLADSGNGTIWRCWATGTVSVGFNGAGGGLIGATSGTIIQSWTDVAVTTNGSAAGGIAGSTGGGLIEQSFAIGSITSVSDNVALGGLVGNNEAQIEQSYSTAAITMSYSTNTNSVLGGVIGVEKCCTGSPALTETYSTGAITAPTSACNATDCIGGWVGYDNAGGQLTYTHNYWDLGTSNVPNKSQGAGNIANDPGVMGLSTRKFIAQLPKGFNRKVWAENPDINGGFPYLIANPPPN